MANAKVVLLAIFVAIGGFFFGYDMGVISGCLIMSDFINRFGTGPPGNKILTSSQQSIITSPLSAGTVAGALLQTSTADSLGRRGTILIWAAVFIAGTAIQTATNTSIVQITIGRCVAGLGVGAMSGIVPVYIGETAPKRLRGTLLVMYQAQITTGTFISFLIELGTHKFTNSASWRLPVGLQMLWGLILLSGIFFLPESPRHLLGKGRSEEARKVIAEVNSVSLDDALVELTIEELEFAIRAENEGGKASWFECFSTRSKMWFRTMNGMMLQFLQQLNGQNFYYYFGDTFFQSAGTELSPYVIQTILGAVSVFGILQALYLIEYWGRRKSLLIGSLLEAACALIAGLVGHFTLAPTGTPISELTPRNISGGDVLIAFAILHVFSFTLTWAATPWVYVGESYPLRVRSKCIALAAATNWVWNFLLAFFSPRIAGVIGPLILLIFCGMLIFAWFYVYFCIPETKGLSLEEVDEMYRSGVKPWNSANWRPHLLEKDGATRIKSDKDDEKIKTVAREKASTDVDVETASSNGSDRLRLDE